MVTQRRQDAKVEEKEPRKGDLLTPAWPHPALALPLSLLASWRLGVSNSPLLNAATGGGRTRTGRMITVE
jgi:hypothetical protein